MNTRKLFLCQLKEKEILNIKQITCKTNDLDIFTKNVDAPTINCNVMTYCQEYEYY